VNGIQIKSSEIGETDMVIDCRTRLTVHYDLLSFLKDINCTSMQFKLLCFWGRHPKAKLSLYTIVRALDTSTINLRDAIANLVAKGILTAQHNNDDLITYALSEQGTQEYIDELGSLDWNQTMNLERQLKKETVSTANESE
jgi:predicted DNA-binding transcriptional regulator